MKNNSPKPRSKSTVEDLRAETNELAEHPWLRSRVARCRFTERTGVVSDFYFFCLYLTQIEILIGNIIQIGLRSRRSQMQPSYEVACNLCKAHRREPLLLTYKAALLSKAQLRVFSEAQ